jgi:hypothetical protein
MMTALAALTLLAGFALAPALAGGDEVDNGYKPEPTHEGGNSVGVGSRGR